MINWKTRKLQKKGKGSQTPGKAKGANCQATPEDRYFAKRSRSYKDEKGYHDWCEKKRG